MKKIPVQKWCWFSFLGRYPISLSHFIIFLMYSFWPDIRLWVANWQIDGVEIGEYLDRIMDNVGYNNSRTKFYPRSETIDIDDAEDDDEDEDTMLDENDSDNYKFGDDDDEEDDTEEDFEEDNKIMSVRKHSSQKWEHEEGLKEFIIKVLPEIKSEILKPFLAPWDIESWNNGLWHI